MKRILLLGLFWAAGLSLTSCASGYQAKVRPIHQAYQRGNYDKALLQIDQLKPSPRDRLLYLLDKGMVLQAAGRYEESNKVLTEAEDLSELLSIKSVSRETAATFWSEEAREYPGDPHERVMIPVVRMLNYLLLGNWDGALVELRRTLHLFEKVYGGIQNSDNGFVLYLSSIIWEAAGHLNDALIDLNRMNAGKSSAPYYAKDIKFLSQRLGLAAPLPPADHPSWTTTARYREERGQLVVVAPLGQAPIFRSESVSTGYFTVAMPVLKVSTPRISYATVSVDGEPRGRTYPFYRTVEESLKALRDRRKQSFKRKMAKVTVQTGLYAVSQKLLDDDSTGGQVAGLGLGLLSLSMSAAEKADERSWITLPAEWHLARFYLSEGEHEVVVSPAGGSLPDLTRTVKISREKPTVIVARFTEDSSGGEVISSAGSTRIQKLKEREEELERNAGRETGNGSLLIELARTRLALGQYDLEPLILKGMKRGGDPGEGIWMLVLLNVVKNEYNEALRWAEKGADLQGGDKDLFRFYREELTFLKGSQKKTNLGRRIPTNKNFDLANGFHHYLAGLNDEKGKDFEAATKKFVEAYGKGLIGKPIEDKIMATLEKTEPKFKKSAEGMALYDKFARVYLETH